MTPDGKTPPRPRRSASAYGLSYAVGALPTLIPGEFLFLDLGSIWFPGPELPPVKDRRYLEGLREVTYAAYAGGIDLMLPHAGWLGWLAMTWGAWGFSGGLAGNSWGDREHGLPMTSPDEPSNPYFESQLLKTVKWRVHEELKAAKDYEACTCPECTAMGDTYDSDAAKRHQIWWANEEATRLVSLDRDGRATVVGGRLDAAIDFRDGLSASLQDRVQASFLDIWRDLI